MNRKRFGEVSITIIFVAFVIALLVGIGMYSYWCVSALSDPNTPNWVKMWILFK